MQRDLCLFFRERSLYLCVQGPNHQSVECKFELRPLYSSFIYFLFIFMH